MFTTIYQFFRRSNADNSGVGGGIWPKFELTQFFMHALITYKNENVSNKKRSYSGHQILTSIKGRNSVANLRKQRFTIPTSILSMIKCLQSLVSFCQFVLKILSKKPILTSIKGRNSVANLRKTMIYNTNVDLVNDNV